MSVKPDFKKVWKDSMPSKITKLAEGIRAVFWVGIVEYGNDKALLFFTSNKQTGFITGRFLVPKEALKVLHDKYDEFKEVLGIE